ncbi:hypothetical protein GC176_13865 [bacterium]|nr:hypothetical protein [bacterium]
MSRIMTIIAVLIVVQCVSPRPQVVEARPLYKSVWEEMYRERLPDRTKVSCSLCHPENSKGKKNKYGRALEKELGEKNVKDRDRVRKALKKIEDLFPVPLKRRKDGESSVVSQPRGGDELF